MDNGSLDILVILDRSGSMVKAKSDHEGGLTSFVEDQRGLPGDVRFTLVQFDSVNPCEVVYDRVRLADVKGITLVPRGATPLLDAMGQSIAHLVSRQVTDAPEQTIVLIVTDGQENASHEWTKARVASRVKELEAGSWKFLFLGANFDSFTEAGSLGILDAHIMNYANQSGTVQHAYASVSANMCSARSMGASASAKAYDFSDEQRKKAMIALKKGV